MIGIIIILSPIFLFFKLVKPTPDGDYMRSHFESDLEYEQYMREEIWAILGR